MRLSCVTCGNYSDRTFSVTHELKTYVFDSIECAALSVAPRCEVCGVRILGHGVEQAGRPSVARSALRRISIARLRDRAYGDGGVDVDPTSSV